MSSSRYKITPPDSIPEAFKPEIPLSKSISNRCLILDALAAIDTRQSNVADCDDTHVMIDALTHPDYNCHNIGAAGTAMRFLTAYLAATTSHTVTIDGSERMRCRPISQLVDALRLCGASIDYAGTPGYPPLVIHPSRLVGGDIRIDSTVSSQFISALLMVAPIMTDGLKLTLIGATVSAPYISMTVKMMRRRGIPVTVTPGPSGTVITVPHSHYNPDSTPVEFDWSAASYWLALGILTSTRVILPTNHNSLQGDATIQHIVNQITRTRGHIDIDFTTCPDLAQTIAVTLCLLHRPYTLTGLQTLAIKETDRLTALCRELGKLGYNVTQHNGDTLRYDGNIPVPTQSDISIDTYNDHRMAMSMSLAAVRHPGIIINDIGVVSKSYPHYWHELSLAGFKLTPV